jgi:hypothetical protein
MDVERRKKSYFGPWADELNRHLQVLLGIYLRLRYVCLVLTLPVVCVAGQT